MNFYINYILVFCLFLFFSCHKEDIEIIPNPEPEPEPEPEWISDTDFVKSQGHVSLWDISDRALENEATERNIYSADYILDVTGVPYNKTKELDEILKNSCMMLLSSPVLDNMFNSEEVQKLKDWVEQGGILIAPAVYCTDKTIMDLFGISGSICNKLRYELSFAVNNKEFVYIDEPEEDTIRVGNPKYGTIYTYGYNITTGEPLATFDTGETGIVRNSKGKGYTYTFGIKWRDIIQRSQLNKDFGANRSYSNAFEPTADLFPLIVRGIYFCSQSISVWKHTIPKGYSSVLIPTHDCDSQTSYDEMGYMSDYERSIGLSAHYFLTVHYYRDSPYMSAFYNQTSIDASKLLLKNNHTIGSHSIGHFPDFNKLERFPLTKVTEEQYKQTAKHDIGTGITIGGSTWAEVVLSKLILERDLGNKVRSFRSGHLCMNNNIPNAMQLGEYSFSSCYSSGDLLTNFPFQERLGNNWEGEFNGVLQIPLHISDVFSDEEKMSESNWSEKPKIWLSVLKKLAGNNSPCVILIHPNRKWKMEAEKMLIDNMDRNSIGIYNFEAYGDFWSARRNFTFEYCYIPEKEKVIVKSDRIKLNNNPQLSFGIDVKNGIRIKEIVLIDKENVGIKLNLKQLSDTRFLAFQ